MTQKQKKHGACSKTEFVILHISGEKKLASILDLPTTSLLSSQTKDNKSSHSLGFWPTPIPWCASCTVQEDWALTSGMKPILASTRELVSNYYFLLFGFLSCLSAFVSEKKTGLSLLLLIMV
jgi:hypothetical protein